MQVDRQKDPRDMQQPSPPTPVQDCTQEESDWLHIDITSILSRHWTLLTVSHPPITRASNVLRNETAVDAVELFENLPTAQGCSNLTTPSPVSDTRASNVLRNETAVDAVELFDRQSLRECANNDDMAALVPCMRGEMGTTAAGLLIECRGRDEAALQVCRRHTQRAAKKNTGRLAADVGLDMHMPVLQIRVGEGEGD